jgi:hypothetical protein
MCKHLFVVVATHDDAPGDELRRSSRNETLAITFLLGGSVLGFAGWLVMARALSFSSSVISATVMVAGGWIIGVTLLWISPQWRLWDKVIGTLLLPGGYLLAVGVFVWQFVPVLSSTGYGCSTSISPPGPTHCTPAIEHSSTFGSPTTLAPTLALLALTVLIPTVTAMRLNDKRRVLAP